ncbi:ornithine carbamoyltransferase [Verrucomicrobiota bacterium]
MNTKLKCRSFLTLNDVSNEEMMYLLDLAEKLKQKKKDGKIGDLLAGKHVAMIFEKMSTRTRCAVAVALADEGGRTEYLSAGEMHLGQKESTADTARVLGRMFDGIFFRGFSQETVEVLSKHAGVPVWNGLTDECHPTQILADLLTMKEKFGEIKGLKLVYIGDGRNNVANSLMLGCAKTGVHFVNCTPKELMPSSELVEQAKNIAQTSGGSVAVVNDPSEGVAGANAVYTDVWASMGEESKLAERIQLLQPYQVNMDLIRKTGNLEEDKIIFLHCLPALHDKNTEITKDTGALEVTDDVFEAPFSMVFEETENRVHTIKALLVASLCD